MSKSEPLLNESDQSDRVNGPLGELSIQLQSLYRWLRKLESFQKVGATGSWMLAEELNGLPLETQKELEGFWAAISNEFEGVEEEVDELLKTMVNDQDNTCKTNSSDFLISLEGMSSIFTWLVCPRTASFSESDRVDHRLKGLCIQLKSLHRRLESLHKTEAAKKWMLAHELTRLESLHKIEAAKKWMLAHKLTWLPSHVQKEIGECWKVISKEVEGVFKKIENSVAGLDNGEQRANFDDSLRSLEVKTDDLKIHCFDYSAESGRVHHDLDALVSGPAVWWAWWSNIFTWAGFPIITLFSAFYTEIDHKAGVANSLLSNKAGLLVIVMLWLLTTLPPLYFEYRAALYVFPAQIAQTGKPFFILSKLQFSFWTYIRVLLIFSFILHTDIFTTAMFVGRVFKSTHSCKGGWGEWKWAWFWKREPYSPLETMWNQSLDDSPLFNSDPFKLFGFQDTTYWQLTCFLWFMMLFQFVYAICYALPVSPDLRNEHFRAKTLFGIFKCRNICRRYKVVQGLLNWRIPGGPEEKVARRRSVYHTLLSSYTSHGRCLQALADSGRMMSVQWLDDEYCVDASVTWDLDRIVNEMRRGLWRFALFSIQSVGLPSIQISFYGVQRHMMSKDSKAYADWSDWFSIVGIALSVILGSKYVVWEMKMLWSKTKRLWARLKNDKANATARRDSNYQWEIIMHQRRAYIYTSLTVVTCFMTILYFFYILTKLFMVFHGCPHASWNVTLNLFDLTIGCVDVGISTAQTWNGDWDPSVCRTQQFLESLANMNFPWCTDSTSSMKTLLENWTC